MIGIFAVDPGVHTGIAWAIVDERSKTAAEAVANRINDGSYTLVGDPVYQARSLFKAWEEFKIRCVIGGRMEPDHVELIMEDFVLRGGQHAGGKDGTAPERIAWAFEGYRHGRFDTFRKTKHLTEVIWQQPSAASTYKTRKRLENASAWIVGKEHERSAFSHMILRVVTIMSENKR